MPEQTIYRGRTLAETRRKAKAYGHKLPAKTEEWRDGMWHATYIGRGIPPYEALLEQRMSRLRRFIQRIHTLLVDDLRRAAERGCR